MQKKQCISAHTGAVCEAVAKMNCTNLPTSTKCRKLRSRVAIIGLIAILAARAAEAAAAATASGFHPQGSYYL